MSLYAHLYLVIEDAMREVFPELERDNDKLHAEVSHFFSRAVPMTREQAIGWGYAKSTEQEWSEMLKEEAGI